MTSSPKFIVGSFLREEGSELFEWLAYHRAIGASAFHIFIDERLLTETPLLDALAASEIITLHRVQGDPETLEEPRNSAIRFAAIEAAETGGYGLFLETDEYFHIGTGAQTVPSLMRSCGGADVMTVPVQLMGTAGKLEHEPGGALTAPRTIQQIDTTGPAANVPLRSVVRLGMFKGRSAEIPSGIPDGNAPTKWINGDGQPMPAPFSRLSWSNRPGALGTLKASILKVPAPSVETYLLRMAAVRRKHRPDPADIAEFINLLESFDTPGPDLAPMAEAAAAHIDTFMSIRPVRRSFKARCAWETAEIATLRARPSGIANLLAAAHGVDPPVAAPAANEAGEPSEPTSPIPTSVADGASNGEPTYILPDWFSEIHTGGGRLGFYNRLENHAAVFVRRSNDRLVVSFDNLSNVNDKSAAREPWAYKFIRDNGCSHLSIFALRKDWYRDRQLIEYLRQFSRAGYFKSFGKVFLTGTSMGGFAALAFASLAPGATVISFNPQTTLDRTLVPWENRFGMGRDRDWSLPHSDCAFEIDEIEKAFVFYDPFYEPDRKHVERLDNDRVIRMKTWCSGHFSPVFLRRADILKPVMQHAIDGTLTQAVFYALYRNRRGLPWYRNALEQNLIERGHSDLAGRVTPAFRKLRREAAE